MVQNPKNKKGLIANIKAIVPAMFYHQFRPGTTLSLYLYEEPRKHTLVRIIHNLSGSVTLITIVDGVEYKDDIKEFDFCEIKAILNILKKEKGL